MFKTAGVSAVIILCLLSIIGCDPDPNDEKKTECTNRPSSCRETTFTEGTLKIKFTLNAQNPTPTIYVYEGDYNTENPQNPKYTFGVDSTVSSPYCTKNIPVGKYSAKISYIVDGAIIDAIDGGSIESEGISYCEGKCYEIQTPTLDCTFNESAYNDFKNGSNDKCFIATAFYGNPRHEKVNVLRNFRDRFLNTCRPGRIFVSWYYKNSPPAADFIRRNKTAHFFAGSILIPIVFVIEHPASLALFPLICFMMYQFTRRRYTVANINRPARDNRRS
jgi:hypothetical protein